VPTVATEILLLLHVPPVVASLRTVVPPMQTEVLPVTAEGAVMTVSVAMA
jgi:hypothetical protein